MTVPCSCTKGTPEPTVHVTAGCVPNPQKRRGDKAELEVQGWFRDELGYPATETAPKGRPVATPARRRECRGPALGGIALSGTPEESARLGAVDAAATSDGATVANDSAYDIVPALLRPASGLKRGQNFGVYPNDTSVISRLLCHLNLLRSGTSTWRVYHIRKAYSSLAQPCGLTRC